MQEMTWLRRSSYQYYNKSHAFADLHISQIRRDEGSQNGDRTSAGIALNSPRASEPPEGGAPFLGIVVHVLFTFV